jgi:hypothetical protein
VAEEEVEEEVEEVTVGPEILVDLGFPEDGGETLYQIRSLMADTLEYLVILVGRNKIM